MTRMYCTTREASFVAPWLTNWSFPSTVANDYLTPRTFFLKKRAIFKFFARKFPIFEPVVKLIEVLQDSLGYVGRDP